MRVQRESEQGSVCVLYVYVEIQLYGFIAKYIVNYLVVSQTGRNS